MAIVNKVDGNFPALIASVAMTASITGDWIRVPANAKSATFLYTATDVGSPVGTAAVEAHFGSDPTDGRETALSIGSAATLDGVGAKNVVVPILFATVGRPQFIRFKYTRSSGGTGDTLKVDATLGL